tara:strand:- start:492 stop:860 length:369 start_codon:yes stop_codon:yes gene_type:complete
MIDSQELEALGIEDFRSTGIDYMANQMFAKITIHDNPDGGPCNTRTIYVSERTLEHLHRDIVKARRDLIEAKRTTWLNDSPCRGKKEVVEIGMPTGKEVARYLHLDDPDKAQAMWDGDVDTD